MDDRDDENTQTIQLDRECYQIQQNSSHVVQPQKQVLIKKYLSGEVKIWFENQELEYEKPLVKPQPMSKTREYKLKIKYRDKVKRTLASNAKQPKKFKPATDHPWRAWTNKEKANKASNY